MAGVPVISNRARKQADASAKGARPTARYLRDTQSGVIASRRAPVTQSNDDIRRAWLRSAGLAMDLIQNSGRLKGTCDQVLADTIGSGLTLTPDPDIEALGYTPEETKALIKIIKRKWVRYAKNKRECDMRGKLDLHMMCDIVLRWHIAYGEATGIYDFFDDEARARYGISTGTKLCLIPPIRLCQDTAKHERLYQGVKHDENGRVVSYTFLASEEGSISKREVAANDADGLPIVLHIFDPMDATDVRGISVLAPAFRKHIQAEMLDDATLQMAILQTVFAVTLTSEEPSADAFEALEALKEGTSESGKDYVDQYMGYLKGSLEAAQDSRISVGADAQVSNLAPGESLDFKSAGVPGQDFQPFSNGLARDLARTMGVTFGGVTMDHSDATYASNRMEVASIWGVVMRRRERIAVPLYQTTYEKWLDEQIGEGLITLKGGYAEFEANRDLFCAANWQGPPKPTADDLKSARASSERLKNKTTSIAHEAADLGVDDEALFETQKAEHDRYVDAGMQSPYAPKSVEGATPVKPAKKEVEA